MNSRDSALVSPEWLEAHLNDPAVQVIEIAGLGQEQMQAFDSGHVPGALGWEWKSMLWDSHARDFPLPQEFARRLGDVGIGNDTTVVVYGEPVQFGVYAWWTFTYCGHRDVRVLDGARQRWQAEGRPWSAEPARPRARTGYTPVARNDQVRIDRNRVLGALGRADTVLLDGRSGEEYPRRTCRRAGRAGHRRAALWPYSGCEAPAVRRSAPTRQELQIGRGDRDGRAHAWRDAGQEHHHVLPHESPCDGVVFRAY